MDTSLVDEFEGTERAEEAVGAGVTWKAVLFVGLSLSIGWGIRGNFGHEYGAMLPGALAAMAAVLISRREDWLRRIAYFALFGALGWAFGGSMSYMQVIAYTHSGDSLSVWYGFACLFVIGFLWGAVGGAGTALPAFLSRERLVEFFPPMIVVFLTFWGWDILNDYQNFSDWFIRHDRFAKYDSDWAAALLAIVAIAVFALVRRRLDRASSFILHLAVGWWAGFLILVFGLHLRMTPPRGDNWAGSVGLVIAMLIYFQRNRLRGVTFAALVAGLFGGMGFATATLFKLMEMTSGYQTNWHSILEQTYGFLNGIGIAVAMGLLQSRSPRVSDEPPTQRWTEAFSVFFVLVLLTYVNIEKEVNDWLHAKTVPENLYFLSAHGWFDLAYLGVALVAFLLLRAHLRRPLAVVPASRLGKGQMLYLVLLWWMVVGNFVKAVVSFAPQRLVTEGTIHFNALLCTLLALLWATRSYRLAERGGVPYGQWIKKAVLIGTVGAALLTLLDWGLVRAVYGNRFAGYAGLHIRFGPRATIHQKPD